MLFCLQCHAAPLRAARARIQRSIAGALLLAAGVLAFPNPAAAHHAMGNRLPVNAFEGFVSGLAHPIIGIDHFAFVVALGLLCVGQRRGAIVLAAFIISALAGTGLHLLQLNFPAAELLIAGSVIAVGALLVAAKAGSGLLGGLGAIAGLLHGYAYGEAIVGATTVPLVAYLIGFTATQYGVALAALWLGRTVSRQSTARFTALSRFAGFGTAAIGVLALTT